MKIYKDENDRIIINYIADNSQNFQFAISQSDLAEILTYSHPLRSGLSRRIICKQTDLRSLHGRRLRCAQVLPCRRIPLLLHNCKTGNPRNAGFL